MKQLKKIFFTLTKKERVVFLVSSGISLVSFIAVIWILIFQTTRVVPAAGGDYTEGMVGQPEYVNPVTASGAADLALVKMVYSNIYDVADKIDESADGRTWTVRLKENLHWQDAIKLTSDDVIFTVQTIQDQNANSPLYQSWQGVAVNRVSELELQFSLANPYAYFSDNLKNLYIVPKHLFANTPPANWRLSDYNLKPIGSGPYEFDSYEKQSDGVISVYHLKAWGDYFGKGALIEHFNLRFFGNTDDLIKNFNSGQVSGIGGVGAGDLAGIGRPYDLFAWRTPSYYAVFFNQSKSLPLQDAAVRQALDTAIDRNDLVTQVLGEQGKILGKPQYGPIPEDAPYFVLTTSTSSVNIASTTLDNAGWIAGTDGFRAKTIQKTSVPLVINLTVPKIDFLTRTADILKSAWEKIGVRVNLSTDTPENIVGRTIKNRDYESLLFGNILGPSSDLYAFWNSSQRFSPGLNLSIYNKPSVDSLISAASKNINDATRADQFARAQNAIVADHPAIFLYSPDYLYVTDKNVQGIAPQFIPDPSDRFRQVPTWYLNTARVLK